MTTCGYTWADNDGEHMCFENIAHPNIAHTCECDATP